jgi:DNA (cytosine-5)-methyltransferase 1
MKVLNLYAGIGGNRKLWEDVDVTAVELDEDIAAVYQQFFPNDKVIVADAHKYLLQNYKNFDFIWSSPPCQSHSGNNKFLNAQGIERYPDMKLWQEIIYLKQFAKCKWVIENVSPYYEVFIPAKVKLDRHLFWGNFNINTCIDIEIRKNVNDITRGSTHYGINLKDYKIKHRKDVILRNMVNPDLGLHILNCARNIITRSNTTQVQLFQ